ncbi:hypothetical protein NG791_22970 [Laspinema sp. D1]|uniref:hypothetical protein n=1 Tax=Laspinema palackyanum TaxID=3231601 RepID=UPI003481C203|nr:hypothetical protein [Laspinema sp. D2b]
MSTDYSLSYDRLPQIAPHNNCQLQQLSVPLVFIPPITVSSSSYPILQLRSPPTFPQSANFGRLEIPRR